MLSLSKMVDVYKAPEKEEIKPEKKGKQQKHERVSVSQIRKVIGKNGREGLFSSFATFPRKVYFETQESGEEIILFLRQHPIVNLGWFVTVLFFLFVPSFFSFLPFYQELPLAYKFVIGLSWYLAVFGYTLARIMGWFFNIFIMTDERLIDVDFHNLLYREISDAKIDKVQDVNSVMSGTFQTFFNYGSVSVQTASEVPKFVFQNIPHPDLIAKYIGQMVDMEEQEKIEGRVK